MAIDLEAEKRKAYKAAYYLRHKEEIKAQRAAYYAAHKEEAKARQVSYIAEHKEEIKAQRAAYREAHKDEIHARDAVYRAVHRDEIKARDANWYATHKDSAKARVSAYRIANRDAVNARHAVWRVANSVKRRVYDNRRRVRKLETEGTCTDADIKDQYVRQKGKCFWCGKRVGKNYHVDHVVPLSKGGSNWPENLVIACAKCNLQKGDRLPHEWAQGGRLI